MLVETYGYPLDLLKSVVVARIMSGVEHLVYLPVFVKYTQKTGVGITPLSLWTAKR